MLDIELVNFEDVLSCIYSKKLLDKLHQINYDLDDKSKINIQAVEKGIIYAKYYHGDQMRESGEPYYSHPLEVAYMVSDYLPRTDIIITAILHDTLEDTNLRREEIAEVFGKKVEEQVYSLTRIKKDNKKISAEEMIENLWQEKKYEILMIKQFDRIHNMQTILSKSPEKIKKITEETMLIFLPLAASLEKGSLEEEIYQLCFKILTPKGQDSKFSEDFSY